MFAIFPETELGLELAGAAYVQINISGETIPTLADDYDAITYPYDNPVPDPQPPSCAVPTFLSCTGAGSYLIQYYQETETTGRMFYYKWNASSKKYDNQYFGSQYVSGGFFNNPSTLYRNWVVFGSTTRFAYTDNKSLFVMDINTADDTVTQTQEMKLSDIGVDRAVYSIQLTEENDLLSIISLEEDGTDRFTILGLSPDLITYGTSSDQYQTFTEKVSQRSQDIGIDISRENGVGTMLLPIDNARLQQYEWGLQ